MRAALRISALALVLGAGSIAHAQEATSEPTPAQVRVAAEAFDRGREAYKSEDYVEAAEQFEKADSNAPSPAALELAIRARDFRAYPDACQQLDPDPGHPSVRAAGLSSRAHAAGQ